MGKKKLTKRERDFDITKYLPGDMGSSEAVWNQVKDPITGSIHAPGLIVDENGSVTFIERPAEPTPQ